MVLVGCGGGGGSSDGGGASPSEQPDPRVASADAGTDFLADVMDRYHERLVVYDDVSSAGNHFVAYGKIPDGNAPVALNGSWSDNPHAGATAMRCEFSGTGFGGFYFLNGLLPEGAFTPQLNFGETPDAGLDLSGARLLRFWARGENGGEKIDFFVAGVGRHETTGSATQPYPGSSPRHPAHGHLFTLTKDWKSYTIDVSGLDLSYLLGGFGWAASEDHNPSGAVFYLDDIEYELGAKAREARLDQPRFLTSFVTLPVQPNPFDDNSDDDIDLVLRNLAFSYDNALALLAFLADGSADGLRRARLIGDAFVYAAEHDRSYDDGRIRTAYAAGDIALAPGWTPNGRLGTVPIPGFWSEQRQQFFEVEQESVDVGNNAWTMIALLALHKRSGEDSYLHAARRIGEFILRFRNDSGTYQGFQGGLDDPESDSPVPRTFASAEHNIDVYAAFEVMNEISPDPEWSQGAAHARSFVEAMWEPSRSCFLAGTNSPNQRNTEPGQLPVDVQAWSILADIPLAAQNRLDLLGCAESWHRVDGDEVSGFDFNEDRDGVWFEGTGHMALAYAAAGLPDKAETWSAELRRAQSTDPYGDGAGIAASARDGLSTGFGFELYRRLHIAATSWLVFAQLGFNPYYQQPITP